MFERLLGLLDAVEIPEVLTQIYGEEDWEATIETVDENEGDNDVAVAEAAIGSD